VTKKCSKCECEKETSEFNIQTRHNDGLSYWCKTCFREYRREHRIANLDEERALGRSKCAERIKWLQDLKSEQPCMDCGQTYEPYCMDYDHVPERGKKIASVSRLALNIAPKERILAEIAKCDLVCVLCHNRRTQQRLNDKLGSVRRSSPTILRNIEIIKQFKTCPCAICGQQYNTFNMQLDHINPSTKTFNSGKIKSLSVDVLLVELAKCQVLCALCHRRKSILEQLNGSYQADRLKSPQRGRMPQKKTQPVVIMVSKAGTTKLLPEQEKSIIRSYRSGNKADQIANDHQVSKSTVWFVLKKNNAPSHRKLKKILDASHTIQLSPLPSQAKGAQKRRMPREREFVIIQAYQDGKTIDEIEEMFQTSRSSIYRILNRNNIPRSNNFSRWTGKTHTPETKEKMSIARAAFWKTKKRTNPPFC